LLRNVADSLSAAAIGPLTPLFYRGVLDRIREKTEAAGCEGFLVLDSHNLIYASGFFHRANERPMGLYVPVDGEPVLLVPHLEKENAEASWISDVRTYPEFPGVVHPVLWMLHETGARRIAVDTLEARIFREASAMFPLLALSLVIEALRFVKQPEELVLVRLAAGYADSCLEHMRAHITNIVSGGGTEVDILHAGVHAALEKMKREIGDAFDGTEMAVVGSVHSGPRGALPHGHTMTRRPASGDTIIAGIGATVGGYHAESGATFVFGPPSADTLKCLQAAAACDAAAVAALRPGIACHDVNTAALAELQRAGLGQFIRHRIGHGMGVQGHEGPWLAPGDTTVVAEGMVFSNEPGIYRPGIDGYRTINTMIVGAGGVEVPSRFQSSFSIEQRILAVSGRGAA
jgi:Xaa-Pro dipeptidase